MKETNEDNLVTLFLKDQKKEIPDFGFSRRVMKNLPTHKAKKIKRLNQLWTFICLVGCFILLFSKQALIALQQSLETIPIKAWIVSAENVPYKNWLVLTALLSSVLAYRVYQKILKEE